MAKELSREREGLQLAKLFLDYCFRCDMLTMDSPVGVIEKLKEYAFKICDDCGGAMCNDHCPVSRYIEDMDKYLKGEKTSFAIDQSYPSLPALPLLGKNPDRTQEVYGMTSNCSECGALCCWAGTKKIAARCECFEQKEK